MNDQEFPGEATSHYRLFLRGEESMPTVVYRGKHRAELQLYLTHAEADIRIVKYALWSCETRDTRACVISDDTDVFTLLCYHHQKRGSSARVMMEPSVNERVCVDISAIVKKHSNIIPQILAIHAIGGFDTVAASYGIVKLKAIATSDKGFLLDSLGVDIPWDSVENVHDCRLWGIRCNHESVPSADVGAKNSKVLKCPQTVFPCADHRGI